MATFTYALDKSVPTDATALSTIDTVFQDMTKALVERNNIDHIWDYGTDADVNVVDGADTGKHRHVVFGVIYADGEDAFDSGVLDTDQTALYVRYSNDTADDDQELYWYDGDNDAVRLTRAGKINLPFADIWYGLDEEDSPLDFGSVMAEEYFVFSAGVCDLVDGGLFDSLDVELTEDYDDPLTDGEVSYERGITADKLNPRKGKFVDGETLQLVDNGVGGKMLSLRPLAVPDAESDPGDRRVYPDQMLYPLMVSGDYAGNTSNLDINLIAFPAGYTIDYIDIKNNESSHVRLQFGSFGTRGNWILFNMAGSIIDYETEAVLDAVVPVSESGAYRNITLKGGVASVNRNGYSYTWTAFGHFVG